MYSFISDYERRKIRTIRIHSKGQKIHVSPQNSQKAHVLANYMQIRRPFFDLDHEKWKPQILQRIAQNPLNSPTHTANHVKLVQFMLISKIPCSLSKTAIFTMNYAKSIPFASPYSESCGISQIRTIF